MAADGLETSRATSVVGGTAFTRSVDPVTGRDDAKRVNTATLSTGSATLTAQYRYDAAGHLTQQWGSGFASNDSTYTYNTTNGLKTGENLQLTQVGPTGNQAGTLTGTYTYSNSGRLLTSTITGGAPERYTFDPAGNLTKVERQLDGVWQVASTLTYQENRLQSYTAPAPARATGGTVTRVEGDLVHTFSTSGTFTVLPGADLEVTYLLLGGGGGGSSGGGGAGGQLTGTLTLTPGTYEVVVGEGGTPGLAATQAGGNGQATTFSTLTASGGGGGAAYASDGNAGASGGGGGASDSATTQGGTTTDTPAQGYPGAGNGGYILTTPFASGGGGGASAAGQAASPRREAGDGGAGITSSITGTLVGYAGGGGGGTDTDGTAGGATHGGGAGGSAANGTSGTNWHRRRRRGSRRHRDLGRRRRLRSRHPSLHPAGHRDRRGHVRPGQTLAHAGRPQHEPRPRDLLLHRHRTSGQICERSHRDGGRLHLRRLRPTHDLGRSEGRLHDRDHLHLHRPYPA